MSDLLWLAATLLLVLFGLPLVRSFDWPGRVAIAWASGIVIGGTLMFVESLIGLRWTIWALLIPAVLVGLTTRLARVDGARHVRRSTLIIAVIFILAMYGAASARMTCGDLLYFWGPKAVHFLEARSIDVEFLRFPHYYLMHPDYPPLQPLMYVWSSVFVKRFSWWGAVLLAPFFLLATVLAFRSFASQRTRTAGGFAVLLAAILAFGFTAGRAAGGADPMLLMFETIALSAVTFGRGREANVIAAIALAGAALTKVEGAAFVVAVVIAVAIAQRRALLAALPSVVLLGSWILFARHHSILDSYGRAQKPLYFDKLGYVLYMTGWQASYRVLYLPWIASLAALPFATSLRRAAVPLLVAGMSLGYTIFFYLHEAEPLWWIKASAERVLMTTLVSLVVASAAGSD